MPRADQTSQAETPGATSFGQPRDLSHEENLAAALSSFLSQLNSCLDVPRLDETVDVTDSAGPGGRGTAGLAGRTSRPIARSQASNGSCPPAPSSAPCTSRRSGPAPVAPTPRGRPARPAPQPPGAGGAPAHRPRRGTQAPARPWPRHTGPGHGPAHPPRPCAQPPRPEPRAAPAPAPRSGTGTGCPGRDLVGGQAAGTGPEI